MQIAVWLFSQQFQFLISRGVEECQIGLYILGVDERSEDSWRSLDVFLHSKWKSAISS